MSTENEVIERRFDDETRASVAIVDGICSLEGIDVTASVRAFEWTLHDYVDPEALDTIMTNDSGAGHVVISFTLEEYHVSAVDSGHVRIQRGERDR